MPDSRPILLVGATGLVGSAVVQKAPRLPELRLVALARRPPEAASAVEVRLADTGEWPQMVGSVSPAGVICALGTTWRQAGRDEAAFRRVDQGLVLDVARAARNAGATRFVLVSSVGADVHAGAFYLRVKGEAEAALAELGFHRLDILRPGLLRGRRGAERRLKERLAILASPLTDALLHGALRRYRSIEAGAVAGAALQLTRETAGGMFVHEHDEILGAAARMVPVQ